MNTNFIVAWRNSERQDWQEYAGSDVLSVAQEMMALCALKETRQVVGLFRNSPQRLWWAHGPRYLIDRRDRSDAPIRGLGGLINSLDSSWF